MERVGKRKASTSEFSQSVCTCLEGGALELCGAHVPKGSSSSHFLIMYPELNICHLLSSSLPSGFNVIPSR